MTRSMDYFIKISSCRKCQPDLWDIVSYNPVDHYKCDNCGKVTNQILRRKNYVELDGGESEGGSGGDHEDTPEQVAF